MNASNDLRPWGGEIQTLKTSSNLPLLSKNENDLLFNQ